MTLQRKGLRSTEQTREPTDSTTQICPTDFDKGRIQWEEDFKQVVLE